jgi:NTE family protein
MPQKNLYIDLCNIENICFEGGGILGIAYIGALERLHQLGLLNNIKRYSGSSVGAICAAALACNCTYYTIKEFLNKLDTTVLKDGGNFLQIIWRLIKRNGLYKGEQLVKWMGDLLLAGCGNRNITFQEAYDKYNKVLILTGTSINQQKTVYYSYKLTPNMRILDAVRISAGYPLVFQDVRIDDDVLIDGGLLNNYPIGMFDSEEFSGNIDYNNKTLGIKLASSNEIKNKLPKVSSIIDYIPALINSIYTQSTLIHINPKDIYRTIVIDIGNISSMDFDINDEDRSFLINQGYKAVDNFYANFCQHQNKPKDNLLEIIPTIKNKNKIKIKIKRRKIKTHSYKNTQTNTQTDTHTNTQTDTQTDTKIDKEKYIMKIKVI